jgi:cytochrome P450
MTALCRPLPTTTFMILAGLPIEDLPHLDDWMDQILHAEGGPEAVEHSNTVVMRALHRYLIEQFEAREALIDPPNDLLTGLVHTKPEGVPWIRHEQVQSPVSILFAALESVTGVLGLSLLFLAEHPGHLKQLVDDPALIPDAVEEFVRYNSPTVVELMAEFSLVPGSEPRRTWNVSFGLDNLDVVLPPLVG